ncbi:MAG: branched-chain amino acid ABC transporter permease [Desulfobacteraceae bacterium]|jgi:branched-chain amino acid transport system permease protein
MEEFLQLMLNGILLGGLYAAVGVGLSMMFGIVKQINLAHGDLMILSSYLSMVLIAHINFLNLWTSLIIVMPIMFIIGFLIQKYILNRVQTLGMEPPLIVAFGLSVSIQNGLMLIFSPDAQSLETSLSIMSIRITDMLYIPVIYVVDFIIGVVVILVLHLFFKKSYLGWAIRAASDDEKTAQLMGIDTKNIYALAMGIAVISASVAGTLVGATNNFYPHTGPQYLIIAFGVIIIGGVDNMAGALLGGLVLGLSQLLGGKLLGSGYQLLSGYLILLALLALRPQGLLSKAERAD